MRKKLQWAVAVLLAAVLFLALPTEALSAQKAILLDATTGRILYERDANSRSLIASTTKIMTALIICEQCNVLDRVRIPDEAVGIEGSSMYLRSGEVLTVQELLYGLMLHSGNDAAVALAIYCGGTVEGFAELMNDKARMLGLSGSHFENPNGLDSPGHYSTASDLAILAAYAMKNPIFQKTVSAKNVSIGTRALKNHNKLLWRLDGADGVKTGYTRAAGRILVSSAVRDGRRLICVTINDSDDWNDHITLHNDGFTNYAPRSVVKKGDCLGSISIFSGQREQVNVIAADDFIYSLSSDEQPYVLLAEPKFAYAPVAEGEYSGTAYIMLENALIGKVPVVYEMTVEMADMQQESLWKRLFGGKKP